jgi:hypothetical protein
MAKTKSKAIVSVADGAGGMMEVKDRRFENGDWPIKFEVPVEQDARYDALIFGWRVERITVKPFAEAFNEVRHLLPRGAPITMDPDIRLHVFARDYIVINFEAF